MGLRGRYPQCGYEDEKGLRIVETPGGEQTLIIYTTADGAYVALRPVCEALGLDVHSQRHRLQRQSWATEVMMTSVAADGKVREMVFIDRRTFTMWLATIDPCLAGPRGSRVV